MILQRQEKSDSGKKLFEQNPGGAPANLLTLASRMGYRTEFIGKVGTEYAWEFSEKNFGGRRNRKQKYLI